MEKVCLLFNEKRELLEFLSHTKIFRCEIDLENLTLTCELAEADIELAIRGFHAQVESQKNKK